MSIPKSGGPIQAQLFFTKIYKKQKMGRKIQFISDYHVYSNNEFVHR